MRIDSWTQLKALVCALAQKKNLNELYHKRIKVEFNEIEKQGANDYWLRLFNDKKKFDHNNNGLVVPWLLGITPIDPIAQSIPHNIKYHPDFPDIDLDFLPAARNPVKLYAAQKYGEDQVCSVGSWQEFKPKSAMQDVLATLQADYESSIKKRHEVTDLTTKLPKEFDEMDIEDALKEEGTEYELFRRYYYDNKDGIDLAYRAVGMLRSQGRHAAGIIIADRPIKDYIPLTYKLGHWISEWTEGKKSQMSKFGFVKFDILGLQTLQYICDCIDLIKKNRNIIIDWSTMDPSKDSAGTVYYPDNTTENISLNDQACIKMANDVQVETIFQFDTPGMSDIIRRGGVRSFHDLVIYTSLGRPGPLPMIDVYIARRDGKEIWEDKEHPRIVEILRDTYGIIVFQEQLVQIWTQLCGMTAPEAAHALKAVAKKKADVLETIKPRIINGAATTIGQERSEKLYDSMITFGRYAFNKCLDGNTLISTPSGPTPISKISIGDIVSIYNKDKIEAEVKDIIIKDDQLYKFTTDTGEEIICTKEHKFLCSDGKYHEIYEIMTLGLDIVEISHDNNH